MKRNRLGNLEQWGDVLEQLKEWKRTRELDNHQDDLLWLLRSRDNWRLREAALEMMGFLNRPTPELVREACAIMMNARLYHEVRVLAAKAVSEHLSSDRHPHVPADPLTAEARQCMNTLLKSTGRPVVHLALRRISS